MIERRHGSAIPSSKAATVAEDSEAWEHYADDHEILRRMPCQEDIVDHKNSNLCQQPAYDILINAEVALQNGEN